ncbi:hypothetical protein [Paenibacillus sp. sgz500958]|uniref:hypothetical protein n=1 Tax=Paenibacillus sp. sgz500958 TaxID=3242475 RepID=UPI0036D3C2AF
MKKRILIACSTLIGILVLVAIIIDLDYPQYPKNKQYVKEYVAGIEGIKGDVDISQWGDNPAYEIGANQEGYAVFKHPENALKQMKVDFAKGIEAIQKECGLSSLSQSNFKEYGTYGWQLVKTEDAEAVEQARQVTSFMDIYENSFDD